jgi:hypothetical protein
VKNSGANIVSIRIIENVIIIFIFLSIIFISFK